MRKAKVNTCELVPGDIVQTFAGEKIFSHFEDERQLKGLFGKWTAVTLVFRCGSRETAEKDGYTTVFI